MKNNELPEYWKIVKTHKNYSVSSLGRVRNNKTRKELKHKLDRKKYHLVDLYNGKGAAKRFLVHRLVAIAFIENVGGKPEVNHKDGNPQNNNAINLEWVTNKENCKHAVDIGLTPRCEKHHLSKLSDIDVISIRVKYSMGYTQRELASSYGVDQSVISRYINRKRGGAYR